MKKTRKWKQLFGLVVAGVLALECMLPQAIWGQVTEDGNRVITQNLISGKNPSFEGADEGVPHWWDGYGNATLSQSDERTEGSKSMRVAPAAIGNYAGGNCNMTGVLETGVTYEYSFDAKLDSADSGKVALVLTYLYGGWSDLERVLAEVDEEYTFSQTEWTHVTGTFTIAPAAGKTLTEIHLAFSAVDSATPFLVDDFKIGTTGSNVTGENLIYDSQFSDESSAWYANANGAQFSRGENDPEEQETLGAGYGYISGRAENWECIGQDITNRVKNNTNYYFSFYAKLSDDYGDATRDVMLCTTKQDSTDSGEQYDKLAVTGGSAQVSANEWTKIEGTLAVAWKGDLKKLIFKIAEQGAALGKDSENKDIFGSYYVANVQMYEIETPKKEIEKNIPNLKDKLTADLGGKAGVAIPVSALNDDVRMELVTKHYNSVTAENEMKPDALLGRTPTIGEDGYPVLDFGNADKLMDYFLDYNEQNKENPDFEPIRLRGHVLLWHQQTPEWFFHENYDIDEPYVEPDEMLERLEDYIHKVMEHFDGADSPYKGMIYAWDVVNEAAHDGKAGLRENGSWYNVFQDSNAYVTQAFVYADRYAPEDVKLFYNDYNETVGIKVEGICKLLQEIKDAGARVDGMGLQGHYDMFAPSVSQFTSAVRAYAEVLGEDAEFQLTELDIKASTNYDGTNQNEEYQKQAYRYKALYDAILSLKKEGIYFSSITFWGTDDGNSWLLTSNSVGGAADGKSSQCPLLFDAQYKAKPAYWAFVDASRLEPNIQNGVAIQAANPKAAAVKKYSSFTAGDAQVVFLPVWNQNGLQVQVEVTDATVDAADAVTVYIDSTNSKSDNKDAIQKYTVTRANATSSAAGYTANFTIPIANLKVMTTIGMDVAVTDGDTPYYWNDLTGNQDNSSKYYGQIVMKPFTEIQKAKVTVDGTIDTTWSKVDAVPLTIITGSAEAAATAKLLWDDTYLYALINVKDADLDKKSVNAHEQDSVEVFVDENNGKTDSYQADDKQYRINYLNETSFNGAKCNADNLISRAVETSDGYYVEAAFKWTDITPQKLMQIGLELQINDASNGSRLGTVSWYDESGMGWSSPAIFGTAMLIDTLKEEKPQPVAKFSVTVSSGTGGGSYEAGKTVTIKANAAPSGKVFDKWVVESGGVKLANASASTTTFVMPAQAVKIKAVYKDKITYFAKFSLKNVSIQKGKTSTALAKDLQIASGDKVKEWKSSDSKIVSVNRTSGKISAKKTGKAVITVTTKQGKKASITVKVVSGKVATTKLTVQNAKTGKKITSGSTVTLKVKNTLNLKAVVAPITSSDKVTFSSDNKKAATVSSTGKITAKKKGTAIITVKSGKKTVKVKVKVK